MPRAVNYQKISVGDLIKDLKYGDFTVVQDIGQRGIIGEAHSIWGVWCDTPEEARQCERGASWLYTEGHEERFQIIESVMGVISWKHIRVGDLIQDKKDGLYTVVEHIGKKSIDRGVDDAIWGNWQRTIEDAKEAYGSDGPSKCCRGMKTVLYLVERKKEPEAKKSRIDLAIEEL